MWAVEGIQSVTDLPLVVSFSFDMGTRTMMGLSPTDAVAAVVPLGVAAVGTNCGRSLADADLVVTEILAAAGDTPVWVKPNAGVPKIVGAEVVYEAGPGDARRARGPVRRPGRRASSVGAAGRRPPTSQRSHRLSAASRTCPLLHARAACCSTSPRCRPAGSTRRHTASSTGSSPPASRGGSCCRCTSPTRSARRTRPGRRSPATKGCSRSPARRYYDDGERRRGSSAGALARGVGAVRRRADERRAQTRFQREWLALKRYANERGIRLIGDIPLYVAGDSCDVVDASGAVRPLRRRRSGTVAEPSRGAALGDAGVRLARPCGGRLRLVARAARARARAVRPAPHRPLPGSRASSGSSRSTSSTRRTAPGATGPGRAFFDAVRERLRRPAADRRGPRATSRRTWSRSARRSALPGMNVVARVADIDWRTDSVLYTSTHDSDTLAGLVGALGPGEPAAARGRCDVRRGRASRVAPERPRGRERAGDHPGPGSPRPRQRGAHEPSRDGRVGRTGSGSSSAARRGSSRVARRPDPRCGARSREPSRCLTSKRIGTEATGSSS